MDGGATGWARAAEVSCRGGRHHAWTPLQNPGEEGRKPEGLGAGRGREAVEGRGWCAQAGDPQQARAASAEGRKGRGSPAERTRGPRGGWSRRRDATVQGAPSRLSLLPTALLCARSRLQSLRRDPACSWGQSGGRRSDAVSKCQQDTGCSCSAWGLSVPFISLSPSVIPKTTKANTR